MQRSTSASIASSSLDLFGGGRRSKKSSQSKVLNDGVKSGHNYHRWISRRLLNLFTLIFFTYFLLLLSFFYSVKKPSGEEQQDQRARMEKLREEGTFYGTTKEHMESIDEYGLEKRSIEGSQDIPRWITHELIYSNTKLFMSFGGYMIDGDRKRPSYSSRTDDILVIILGTGEFTAEPYRGKVSKKPLHAPKLYCRVSLDEGLDITLPAVIHTNATAFQNKLDRYGNLKYRGEKSVWISCVLPRSFSGSSANRDKKIGFVDIFARDSSGFRINAIPLYNFLAPEHSSLRLIQCSAPIHSLTGTQWLIEWIEYQRIIGFDHVNIYVYKPHDLVYKVLKYYSESGFVTVHDWSSVPANPLHGVHVDNWEHGQRVARNDCFLRYRGITKYIAFSDVDELFSINFELDDIYAAKSWHDQLSGPADIRRLLRWFEEQHHQSEGQIIGFLFRSVTVPPFDTADYNDEALISPKVYIRGKNIFLSSFSVAERRCQEPYNCGEFHKGRQKYILRSSKGSINPNNPLFYHAISENYDEISRPLMMQVPIELGYLRHYAGHFKHSRIGGLPPNNRSLTLPSWVLHGIRKRILYENILELYETPQSEQFLRLNDLHNMNRFKKPTDIDTVKLTHFDLEKPSSKKGILTFERFGGRLNNQLLTYDWVFRISLAFNRIAFIPYPSTRESWIGLPATLAEEKSGASIWNLTLLRQTFDFIMPYDEDYKNFKSIIDLAVPSLPVQCVWNFDRDSKFLALFMENANRLEECKNRIHFRTKDGLVHPYRTDTRAPCSKYGIGPLLFWSTMTPALANYIMEAANQYLSKQRSSQKALIGIHSRSHNSYNEPMEKAIARCSRLAQKTLKSAANYFDGRNRCCELRIASLDFKSKFQELRLPEMCNITETYVEHHHFKGKTIIYASDHENAAVDSLLYKTYDASSFDSKTIVRPEFQRKNDKIHYRKNIEAVLADMIVMSKTDYFHGGPSSTVSYVICFWRLVRAKALGMEEESNMCGMLLLSTGTSKCELISCNTVLETRFANVALVRMI